MKTLTDAFNCLDDHLDVLRPPVQGGVRTYVVCCPGVPVSWRVLAGSREFVAEGGPEESLHAVVWSLCRRARTETVRALLAVGALLENESIVKQVGDIQTDLDMPTPTADTAKVEAQWKQLAAMLAAQSAGPTTALLASARGNEAWAWEGVRFHERLRQEQLFGAPRPLEEQVAAARETQDPADIAFELRRIKRDPVVWQIDGGHRTVASGPHIETAIDELLLGFRHGYLKDAVRLLDGLRALS